jgi:hypothetical protein
MKTASDYVAALAREIEDLETVRQLAQETSTSLEDMNNKIQTVINGLDKVHDDLQAYFLDATKRQPNGERFNQLMLQMLRNILGADVLKVNARILEAKGLLEGDIAGTREKQLLDNLHNALRDFLNYEVEL